MRHDLPEAEHALILHLSPDEPMDLDALALKADLPAATCAAALVHLELKRLVKQLPGKRFIRSR